MWYRTESGTLSAAGSRDFGVSVNFSTIQTGNRLHRCVRERLHLWSPRSQTGRAWWTRSADGRRDQVLSSAQQDEVITELPAPEGALAVERVVFGFRRQDRPGDQAGSFGLAAGARRSLS